VVHAWRPGHWYTNAFEVGSFVNPGPTPPPAPGKVTTNWQLFPGVNNVASRIEQPTVDKPPVHFVGVFNTTAECFAAANSSSKGPFHSFTFHTPAFGGPFGAHCYGDTSYTWTNDKQSKIDSGRGPGFPIGPGPPTPDGPSFMFSQGKCGSTARQTTADHCH
jgi:hypothetical protein